MKKITFILSLLICHTDSIAQLKDYSYYITKKIAVQKDTLQFDTLSIAKHSFVIKEVSSDGYFLDDVNASLYFKTIPHLDSVEITYRALPFSFSKKYFHKDPKNIETNTAFSNYIYTENDYNPSSGFVDVGQMNYNGSFSRALNFGNNQDVSLNSNFNLQLDGDLGDSIHVTGAITDNTIPFQPEGNTQQLNEFDRVYLKLSRKKTSMVVGDYEIFKPNAYFMNFYKRVQGLQINSAQQINSQISHKLSASGAIAKGKYVRNILTPIEGNQGPYRLIGPNGEQFFIILANSERIYIDGVLMQRGEELDYIIDYNTAEITFMPRRLITKDLRLIVEYEFSDRNFFNSLLYVNNEWIIKNKLAIRFNAFSNQDSKNQSVLQTLDENQKFFLSTIGDSISKALYPSVQLVDSFSSNKIQYKKIDTIVNNIAYNNIYVYSTNADSAKYVISFTYVGEQKGNYKQQIINANGRVYEWVAPINGQPIGNYEPVIALVTPKKIQQYTLAASYDIDSNKQIIWETSLSNNDPNLFSRINNDKHVGLAQRINYIEKRIISKAKKINTKANVSYEYLQPNFTPIERYRTIEFNRDWNSNTINTKEEEHFLQSFFEVNKNNTSVLQYQLNHFSHGSSYSGLQHIVGYTQSYKGFNLNAVANVLNQKATTYQSEYIRPTITLEKRFKKNTGLVLGSKYLGEKNSLFNRNDSLMYSSFYFNTASIYVQQQTKNDISMRADYVYREDKAIQKNDFVPSNHSHTFSTVAHIGAFENHTINITGSYRNLVIDNDSTLMILKPDQSLLGRIDYSSTFLKGVVQATILYEFGSGQEIKREFAYLEVPAGQGYYTWKDYNQDSVKQLNEFEIAIFQDEKRYIKIYTPTNQYVKAKYAQYNQTLVINPKAYFTASDLKKYQRILNLFYLQSALQLNNRNISSEGLAQYNPFIAERNNANLLTNAISSIHSIYINKFSNQWNADYTKSMIQNKTLLNYGVDTRKNKEHALRGNYSIHKSILSTINVKFGSKSFSSLFLDNRSYEIAYKNISPSVSYIFNKNKMRIQLAYKFDDRLNVLQNQGERAIANAVNTDLTINTINKGTLRSSFSFTTIRYNANTNTTIGYTMLDGLQRGKNILWTLSLDRRLSKNIEMNIEYNGRKSENASTIHSGRASIRALF